ncbi:MAG: bifunctional protein-serine/threonine kinase/phosphatase [Gammaproteobacteria bacterium]|nr:MAG: bifunctional protein-serine/threonine kinase/phosphatase [Gammaproteobacteria bacterium]
MSAEGRPRAGEGPLPAAPPRLRVGQHSAAGPKPLNEDSCGIRLPEGGPALWKGAAAVVADGVSAAEAGKEAAEACVQGFLGDYYSTPDSWTVKHAAGRVITALNRWLYGQSAAGRGMVSTLTAVVVKGGSAHLFHVGDSRAWRLRRGELEQLTRDHQARVGERRFLARAMGLEPGVEIDYRRLGLEAGDVLALTTDGVHDVLAPEDLARLLEGAAADPEAAARRVVEAALAAGTRDNATCQVLAVEALGEADEEGLYARLQELPFPPPLEPGMILDGYRILRELHASARTQVYLALEPGTGRRVVLKTPSPSYQDDPAYIERFLHEEWIGRRVRSPHLLRFLEPRGPRQFLYQVTEHVEGQTLRQWMDDRLGRRRGGPGAGPADLETARGLLEQIGKGLQALHRMDTVHLDLKPENVLVDRHGTVKLIDFGSARVGGLEELAVPWRRDGALGTLGYLAPEILQGYPATPRADVYSLGVLAYELLSGGHPYGGPLDPRRLGRARYRPLSQRLPEIPAWVDGAIRKAVSLDPRRRQAEVAELLHDLRHPNPELVPREPLPLLERDPVAFWRGAALLLAGLCALLLGLLLAP